jgi:SMI1 / KNR4 family (SUKH-1)
MSLTSTSQLFEQLTIVEDTRVYAGATEPVLNGLATSHNLVLPDDYRAALKQSNGLEVYGGYLRLFGLQTTQTIDAIVWNEPNYWKFAWEERCTGYWCFAETAFGDQYGYSLASLRADGRSPVYWIDAFSMSPEIWASSFNEFLEKEFIRAANGTPNDEMIRQARQKLGPLNPSSHVIYIPSTLLSGPEDVNNLQKMDARIAMIYNGDIAIQLDAGPPDGSVKGVQPYRDEYGRMRLRLLWA